MEDVQDDTEEIAEVGSLIEGLNSAIDHVNLLEDEAQACANQHAAAKLTLRSQIIALEAEFGSFWHSAALGLGDAHHAADQARQQLATAEDQAAQHVGTLARLQSELNATGLWEARMKLTSRQAEVRALVTAANKAVTSARKGMNNALAREEKAFKHLQKVHSQDNARQRQAGFVTLPTEEDFGLIERWLSLCKRLHAAAAEEARDLSAYEKEKEKAAAAVSAAMQALEVMHRESPCQHALPLSRSRSRSRSRLPSPSRSPSSSRSGPRSRSPGDERGDT